MNKAPEMSNARPSGWYMPEAKTARVPPSVCLTTVPPSYCDIRRPPVLSKSKARGPDKPVATTAVLRAEEMQAGWDGERVSDSDGDALRDRDADAERDADADVDGGGEAATERVALRPRVADGVALAAPEGDPVGVCRGEALGESLGTSDGSAIA